MNARRPRAMPPPGVAIEGPLPDHAGRSRHCAACAPRRGRARFGDMAAVPQQIDGRGVTSRAIAALQAVCSDAGVPRCQRRLCLAHELDADGPISAARRATARAREVSRCGPAGRLLYDDLRAQKQPRRGRQLCCVGAFFRRRPSPMPAARRRSCCAMLRRSACRGWPRRHHAGECTCADRCRRGLSAVTAACSMHRFRLRAQAYRAASTDSPGTHGQPTIARLFSRAAL